MKQTHRRKKRISLKIYIILLFSFCIWSSALAQSDGVDGTSEEDSVQLQSADDELVGDIETCEIDDFLWEHAGVKQCLESTNDTLEIDSNVLNLLTQGVVASVSSTVESDPWNRPRENFVNWENAHVYPLDITPNGRVLLAVNTADNSLMVFNITSGIPVIMFTAPVGLDPVSVRARTDREYWVVNHASDSVSIVSFDEQRVIATLQTDDEPADVVFAGSPQRAFVSASQANRLNVFDPNDLDAEPESIFINGEDPRALAVSNDGSEVYLAIFESGNGTIALTGGKANSWEIDIPRHSEGPYNGLGIPPNDGNNYNPPLNPDHTPPRAVSMIVREDENGNWIDDNNGDWTRYVSGDLAGLSSRFGGGRVEGWQLPDRDVAIIDANTLDVSYQTRMMNALMAMDVHPTTGEVTVVGTDATNEIRWEPNLNGTFLRVNMATFMPGASNEIIDLNPLLDYSASTIPQSERDRSIGDPRGIVWNEAGTRAYVTGMGSNNVIGVDTDGNRQVRIEVGEGPTGIAIQESSNRAFVLNKFEGSISVLNLDNNSEIDRIAYFDPTPQVIKDGRPFLYDTHETSGLGQASCASCHIDGRTDRLSWDLGNPAGEPTAVTGLNTSGSAVITVEQPALKGPLLTMTLQDIIGHPSMHWSGDKDDLGHFEGAFGSLQGDDTPPTVADINAFETFLDSIYIPSNPNRNFDNSYSTAVEIPGPNGIIARVGDANAGAIRFENGCRRCHPGNTGRGNNLKVPSSNGFGLDIVLRPPTWRNFHERFGLWYDSIDGSNSGFGFQQDGTFDSEHNGSRSDDLMAFMISFNGGFPYTPDGLDEGNTSKDTHAAVGKQVMINSSSSDADIALRDELMRMADSGVIGLVVNGSVDSELRGYAYLGGNNFQSDRLNESVSNTQLAASVQAGSDLNFTATTAGSEIRIGIDRDLDGLFNQDEIDQGTDPTESDGSGFAERCAITSNVAQLGVATQSSEFGNNAFPASRAIDGNLGNFSHTSSEDTNPSWTLTLDNHHDITSIVLHNRDSETLALRLRDITVYILDETGEHIQFKSHYLNRNNRAQGPDTLTIDLVAITGGPVNGNQVRIVRSPDPFSLGTDGDEGIALTLGEVQVFACNFEVLSDVNIAQGRSATQHSNAYGGVPGRAVDGNTSGVWGQRSVTHTPLSSVNAWWQVDLEDSKDIGQVTLWNRTDDCCSARLSNFFVFVSENDFAGRSFDDIINDDSIWRTYHDGEAPTQLDVPVNVDGRYVRVQLAGTNALSLAEVEVFENETALSGVNIAQGRPTTQQSNSHRGVASRAVDGNSSGVWRERSVTHTQDILNAWWQVDLERSQNIDQVGLWNRIDCCSDRLSDFYVFVSDSDLTGRSFDDIVNDNSIWRTFYEGEPPTQLAVSVNENGRYVRVQLAGKNPLSLAEVAVFSSENSPISVSSLDPLMANADEPLTNKTIAEDGTLSPTAVSFSDSTIGDNMLLVVGLLALLGVIIFGVIFYRKGRQL